MSTRRPRIKAITSVPVRRKYAKDADILKDKHPVKESIEEKPKSPRTSHNALESQEEHKISPIIKTSSPVRAPSETSLITCTAIKDEPNPNEVRTSFVESPKSVTTPERATKVSVITPNLDYRPSNPSSASSGTGDNFASKCLPSPKLSSKAVGVIVERLATPVIRKTPASHNIDEHNELQITSLNVKSVEYNGVSSKGAVLDDDNAPSVCESVENEGMMDGIVPLQAEKSGPKPIDLLKNEIISEKAEVLFDPIIPLPSPTKLRPKLRPTPRLGPQRRSSIQGSASESEDESRRAQLGGATTPSLLRQRRNSHSSFSTLNSVTNRDSSKRTRNDSACSSTSQIAGPSASSPVKEKTSKKNNRRLAAMKLRPDTVKRETLTMYDLIFYNPTSNPIVPDEDEVKAKEDSIKDELERKKKEQQKLEKPQAPVVDKAPVPQVKLGPNGEIILDKSSLVINQTDANRDVSTVVREGSWGSGANGRYTRRPRTAAWSSSETVRFYRALASLGTDFSLMTPLFPDRTRRELKLKFKKEERSNGAQVDKALRMGNPWDPKGLQAEFQEERETAAQVAKQQAEKLKLDKEKERERLKRSREVRVRNSRASKALESTMLPGVSNSKPGDLETLDDIINYALAKKAKSVVVPEEKQPPHTVAPNTPSMTTLTLINNRQTIHSQAKTVDNPAIVSVAADTPLNLSTMTNVPANVEDGSLVVLTASDPSSPSRKMMQTYVSDNKGNLTPIALHATVLQTVVDYIKNNVPESALSSPQFASPSSVVSQDSRASVATPGSGSSTSPVKRMSSYTITQL